MSLWTLWRRKNLLSLPAIEPRTVEPLAWSLYPVFSLSSDGLRKWHDEKQHRDLAPSVYYEVCYDSILRRVKRLFPYPECLDLFWDEPSLIFNTWRGSSQEVRRPGREADHWTPSSAKVQHTFTGWRWVKHMTNFIITFTSTSARKQVMHCCKNVMDQNKSHFQSYVLTC